MNPLLLAAIGIGVWALMRGEKTSSDTFPNGSGGSGGGGPLPGTQTGDAVKALADQVDADIRAKGIAYDHSLLSQFQQLAGIVVDGLYGPESALALARYTGRTAPSPVFVPKPAEAPPATPPSATELDQATDLAGKIESDIKLHGMGYDHEQVRGFQRLARLGVDGLYGPATAGALQYFLKHDPPTPLYNGSAGNKKVVPYTPKR